ncbi:extracellular metalloprotease [Physcia stellaris]|nr:extracellular metalloprotease [Physcia stellaris]
MLFLTSLTLSATLPSLVLAHPYHIPLVARNASKAPSTSRLCGTGPPSAHLLNAHQTLHRESHLANLVPRKTNVLQEVFVDTYVHVVTTSDQARHYTPEILAGLVANQTGVLNHAYSSANITFRAKPYTYTINDAWATDADDKGMKTALRKGNYSALNIYFQTNLSTPAPPGTVASTLLGYCTLPNSVTYTPTSCAPQNRTANGQCQKLSQPTSTYINDGCNVLAATMPNNGLEGYQEGKTAVHEVGHWFGLLHTFQDESCDASDQGDYVDDTPQESVSTDGCPPLEGYTKKSCPNSKGDDPVHNFMDYSSDACYTGFSNGQRFRMVNLWNLYRKGN